MSLPVFVSEQHLADNCVHFMNRVLYSMGVRSVIQRVPITEQNSFKNLEDILSNVKLIPLEEPGRFTLFDIQQQMARDNLSARGEYLPEYGIVAVYGASTFDKPITSVMKDGERIYIPNPEIGKRIRRFVYQKNT